MAAGTRRTFLKSMTAAVAGAAFAGQSQAAAKPNFVIVFCDDLGYGDLGVFGHPTMRTPNLDRMAAEGQKWTSFYVGAPVCTPSRAALLTGRLPIRNGMCSAKRRVLFPDSARGIPAGEITLAEALRDAGYATACVGKWHLGHLPPYLPTANGFDSYFGIPYSNDMDKIKSLSRDGQKKATYEAYNVPLMRDTEIIERPANQNTITKRYADEAVKFIKSNKDKPFFLYLANSMPHIPLFASDEFRDTSPRGLYGDVIEEIDHGVGRVLDTLREEGLAENTLVVFTSDNGPWLIFKTHGGSAGLLRGGKGGTFEGGMREPTIFWWPGKIAPGVVHEMGATMDLFPTFCALAGAKYPDDRVMDGYDLAAPLFNGGPSPRDEMFYYREAELYAIRKGPWKAHYLSKPEYTGNQLTKHDPPLLYHLEHDPSEKYDLAEKHPEIIEMIAEVKAKHLAELVKGEDQLAERIAEAK